MPTFTEKNNQQPNTETQSSGGLGDTIANFVPLVLIALEQFTGKSIPQLKGTLADILANQQRLEAKLDEFTRDCSQQFIHQEKQLASLQQVSELISNEKTKTIRFGNAKPLQIED